MVRVVLAAIVVDAAVVGLAAALVLGTTVVALLLFLLLLFLPPLGRLLAQDDDGRAGEGVPVLEVLRGGSSHHPGGSWHLHQLDQLLARRRPRLLGRQYQLLLLLLLLWRQYQLLLLRGRADHLLWRRLLYDHLHGRLGLGLRRRRRRGVVVVDGVVLDESLVGRVEVARLGRRLVVLVRRVPRLHRFRRQEAHGVVRWSRWFRWRRGVAPALLVLVGVRRRLHQRHGGGVALADEGVALEHLASLGASQDGGEDGRVGGLLAVLRVERHKFGLLLAVRVHQLNRLDRRRHVHRRDREPVRHRVVIDETQHHARAVHGQPAVDALHVAVARLEALFERLLNSL